MEKSRGSQGKQRPYALEPLTSFPADMTLYPFDFAPLLLSASESLDEASVPLERPSGAGPGVDDPTKSAQLALAHWNAFHKTGSADHREGFLAQARWLASHEVSLADGVGGWPMPFPHEAYYAPAGYLSALTQGIGLSVLAHAHELTHEDDFLRAAQRIARTFALDALDGGVATPIGDDGVCFEEIAVYPAGHQLAGFIFGLLGLYDYVALTNDEQAGALIRRGLTTLDGLLSEYDTGFWTRRDLLSPHLASPANHALQVTLLQALARRPGNERFAATASRWSGYQRSVRSQARCFFSRASREEHHQVAPSTSERRGKYLVSIPITAFPVVGGMRSVLTGVETAMRDHWDLEYLTQHVGPDADGLTIHPFGNRFASPWQYPNVKLYERAGRRTLTALLRHGARYRVIVPQDGVFTSAFCVLVGKAMGIRVVCMDHGTVTLPFGSLFREERMKELAHASLPLRVLSRLRYALYWPTLRSMARITARYADFFLISGDDVEQTFLRLGVSPTRILRYPYMIDADRYHPLEPAERKAQRARLGIADDDIVVTLASRLAPEKGLHIAIPGIREALSSLSPQARAHTHILIAGDGPSRAEVEADIRANGLEDTCRLLGALGPNDIASLLGMSDIFLYTSTRGAGRPMAVLESMAAGCAVIAARQPDSLSAVLAEGRGLAIPTQDSAAVATALKQLIGDSATRQRMGHLAREHIQTHYSSDALRRCLLRATFWAPSTAPRETARQPHEER
ncbi:MAG TPA: D-glucuronyl C5-epimerase family protein [Ktedonobacterales bacterium]